MPEDVAYNRRALDKAMGNLNGVLDAGRTGSYAALPGVGLELTSLMKLKLSTPGRGRLYRGRRGRGDHVASAPGDPPAPDVGQYRASWRSRAQGNALDVGTGDKRGPWLEFGTSKMAARPHARPTVQEYTPTLRSRVANGYERGQQGAIAKLPRETS